MPQYSTTAASQSPATTVLVRSATGPAPDPCRDRAVTVPRPCCDCDCDCDCHVTAAGRALGRARAGCCVRPGPQIEEIETATRIANSSAPSRQVSWLHR